MIVYMWAALLPAISAVVYCRKLTYSYRVLLRDTYQLYRISAQIILFIYRHRRQMNEFLSKNTSISRGSYMRVMALGILDMTITLPTTILGIVVRCSGQDVVFWPGWTTVHAHWAPTARPAHAWKENFWRTFNVRFAEWYNILFALIFVLLFGLTGEALACYRRAFWGVAGLVGCRPRERSDMSDIVFGSRPAVPEAAQSTSACILLLHSPHFLTSMA